MFKVSSLWITYTPLIWKPLFVAKASERDTLISKLFTNDKKERIEDIVKGRVKVQKSLIEMTGILCKNGGLICSII
jgi:hypothetical protein